MNELVALWERLRIMNRSLEEDLRRNEADMMNTLNGWDIDTMQEEYVAIKAKQEQLDEIMGIVERMMGVAEDKKPIHVEPRKTNYIKDTIELLEEDLLEAKHKLEEHYKAVEKAEWLLENKEWIEHDNKDLVNSIQDAIDALRRV